MSHLSFTLKFGQCIIAIGHLEAYYLINVQLTFTPCTLLLYSTFDCNLDTKCSVHPRCWYCFNRCDTCFARAQTLAKPDVVDDIPVNFCSKPCKEVFLGPNKPITILAVATNRISKDTPKIEKGHREICCISGEGRVDGLGLRFKISVRVNGQGRYYCIFHFRTLFTQHCAELYLNRDTSPDTPLPHVQCTEGYKTVGRLKDEGILQQFIQAGFRVIKKQYESGVPSTLAQAMVSEEITSFPTHNYVQRMTPEVVHKLQDKEDSKTKQVLQNITKYFPSKLHVYIFCAFITITMKNLLCHL